MIDAAAVRSYRFAEQTQGYAARDAILYALGLGLGRDPVDPADLRFLDERELSVLPTFAVTLCSPGMWIRDPALGVDLARLVHSSQEAQFFFPLPPAAEVIGSGKTIALDTPEFLVRLDGAGWPQFLKRFGERIVVSSSRIAWSEG